MISKSRSGCRGCQKEKLKCDRRKPICENCMRRRTSCTYPVQLKWGGQPYKDKNKVINIPENTVLVDGILTAKNKTVAPNDGEKKVKGFVLVQEPLRFKCKSNKTTEREDEIHEENFINEQNQTKEDGEIKGYEQIKVDEQIKKIDSEIKTPVIYESLLSTGETSSIFSGLENRAQSWISSPAFSIMPNFMPDLIRNSYEHSDLFRFFIQETSSLFVVSHRGESLNPFGTMLPQMAMHCPTLMNLLIAFAGKHRKRFQSAKVEILYHPLEDFCVSRTDYDDLARKLLDQSIEELINRFMNPQERCDDVTLASLLLLMNVETFFGDHKSKWRMHLYAARRIMMDNLKNERDNNKQQLYYSSEVSPHYFLRRWFTYLNVVSILSSADFELHSESVPSAEFHFAFPTPQQSREAREQLGDIEVTSGMDSTVLSYLSQVAQLLCKMTKSGTPLPEIMRVAIELDYEIISYFEESEKERDLIIQKMSDDPLRLFSEERISTYSQLRTTNMIFGLTGALVLRGRVLSMPQDSKMTRSLLIRISDLMKNMISPSSSGQSCLFFCIFCCGCELISPSMASLRPIYTKQLMALKERGMPSAHHAKVIMEECWATGKHWWELLKENDLDFCFVI